MSRMLHPVLKAGAATTVAFALTATTVLPATATPVAPEGTGVSAATTATADPAVATGQAASEVKGKDQQAIAIGGIDAEALPAPAQGGVDAAEPSGPDAASGQAGSTEGDSAASGAVVQGLEGKATVTTDAPVAEAAELAPTALADALSTEGVEPDKVAALTQPMETIDFIVAGVTWDIADAGQVTDVSLRVREEAGWTDWNSMEIHDGDEMPGAERVGTEPLATMGADAIQVRIETVDGKVPSGLELELIDPGQAETDGTLEPASPASPALQRNHQQPTEAAQASAAGTASAAAYAPAVNAQQGLITGTAQATTVASTYDDVLKPAIITRAQWGADESIFQDFGTPSTDLKAMYVHHTAGSNNYTRSGAYQQIRGIYSYHATSLDWGDIGYQFLVDKYGNIYQGRRGSLEAPVQGAQAGGFNTDTIGVSAMGNYDVASAPAAMVSAIERVLAWQAYRWDLDPTSSTTLTQRGKGTARWYSGKQVTVPTILGHRTTNFTACPGRYLYAKLPSIRTNVDAKVAAAKKSHGEHSGSLTRPVTSSTSYSLLLPGTSADVGWGAAAADDYQIMYRAVPHGGGDISSQSWTAGRTTAGTSLELGTYPGETAQFAVRSRRGGESSAQTYLGQHTGPLSWTDDAVRTSGMTLVDTSSGVEGKGYQSVRAGGILNIGNASRANRLVVAAKVDSGTVRVRVEKDGRSYGTLLFSAGAVKYRGVDLPTGGNGTIRLKVMDSKPITFTSVAVTRPGQSADAVAVHRANCGPRFGDNKPGSGHFTAIQWMACEKISVGYSSDNTFRKNQNVTRGETAQFMYKMTAQSRSSTSHPFKDSKTAYAKAISWFAAEGISVGYTDRTFRPNRDVTRGELAAFLYGLADSNYEGPRNSPFEDLKPTSPNYDAITWLRSQGVTSGYADGSFKPSRSISRAETAAFLQSFYDGPQRFL